MRLRKQIVGTLNLFGTTPGSMDPADPRIIQALADVATIGLLQERAIHAGDALAGQLQGALPARILIEQAKGSIAQLRGAPSMKHSTCSARTAAPTAWA